MNRRDFLRGGLALTAAGLLIPDKKVWALDQTMMRRRVAVIPLLFQLEGGPVYASRGCEFGVAMMDGIAHAGGYTWVGWYEAYFQNQGRVRIEPDVPMVMPCDDLLIRLDGVTDGSLLDFSNTFVLGPGWNDNIVTAREEYR